jgi:hypothetical protein
MRLPNGAHESHPWRIRQLVPDFRLEDVWALPVQGGAEDFDALLEVMGSLELAKGDSRATRALFTIRKRVGALLGWDDSPDPPPAMDAADTTVAARLPRDLRNTATGPDFGSLGFHALYRTEVEWAAELSNRTVHGVLHVAWVEQGEGLYRGQLAVYVKPRGRLGGAYMAAIAPFRHWVVYPALMRQIERAWSARTA